MARSTFRRTPLQNNVDFDDLNGGFFHYTKFGGLCDNRNDAVIDQETFADCKNVFVNTNELLTSRPPFKFLDDEAYIVKKWVFGEYTLQFHRVPIDADGNRVDSSADLEDISFLFILRCISHDTIDDTDNGAYGVLAWQIDANDLGWDNMPKIKPVHIEDKIYFWFAGVSFVCFNTAGRKSTEDESDDTLYPYFEDAMKYIYLPIHTLAINGIESELESLNYLTNTYRKRYIYSALSSVNFASLIGKHLSIGLNGPNTQSTSKHLYDIVANSANFNKILIYPKSEIGSSYYTTMVKTPNSNVYLRYIFGTSLIEVSFDGSYYRSLPTLEDIIAEPIITGDGLYVVAFTSTRVAKCRLVAQESTDFADANNIFLWEYSLYWEGQDEYDSVGYACGVFPTIDNCAWICSAGTQYTHIQWLRGTEDIVVYEQDTKTSSGLPSPAVMAYQYIIPTTDNPNIGPIIAGLSHYDDPFETEDDRRYLYIGLLSYNNTASIQWIKFNYIRENINIDGIDYTFDSIPIPVDNFDIRFYNYVIDSTSISINLSVAFSARYVSADGDIVDKDILYNFDVNKKDDTLYVDESSETYKIIGENSVLFKLSQSVNDVVLTDSYLWYADESLTFHMPEISKNVLGFGDRVALITDASLGRKYVGNVYKLRDTSSNRDIVFGNIVSGDSVYYGYAGYSMYDIEDGDDIAFGKTISKLRVSPDDEWESVTGGDIRAGDIVQIGTISQPIPTGWSIGDDWPETLAKQGILPPLIIEDGQVRSWRAGDAWPGVLTLGSYTWKRMGYVDFVTKSIPLYVDDAGVYYNINGTIWTSDISSDADNQLEIDEVINAEYDENGDISDIGFNNNLPDCYGSFNDYFISFADIDTGYNLLEITSTRREESRLDAYRTDFLFYLPINSEERFSEKITNIHPIADTAIGIFTETSIYYISSIQLEIGLSYSKPIKSKIPLGVREGDDVITALNGQVILFATKRGIAFMTPQDFIASTERTLVYLSDAIQNRYEKFYNQSVKSASLIPNEFDTGYKCMIKICAYRYWLLFYRYMDNQILAYDTRYNAWWIWTTPYPIRELIVTNRLEALLQIDFNPVDNSQIILPANKFPFMGIRYLWTDDEVDLDTDVSGAFPTLNHEYEANESYYDDVIEGALNGDSELIYDNKFAGSRRQLSYASPTIEWHITSQKLHFNALNNYKLIQAIYMTAKGVDNMTATLSTKAYRDAYHPESSIVFQMRINDLRTFLKRMNLMHTQFFQFVLSNDSNQETQKHLKLDSISIRYEVKGVIR